MKTKKEMTRVICVALKHFGYTNSAAHVLAMQARIEELESRIKSIQMPAA